jgi:hypothetical protein
VTTVTRDANVSPQPPGDHGYSAEGAEEFARLAVALAERGHAIALDQCRPTECAGACPLCAADGRHEEIAIYAVQLPRFPGRLAFTCPHHPMYDIGRHLGVRTGLMDAIGVGRQEFSSVVRAIEAKGLGWRLVPHAAPGDDLVIAAQCPQCVREKREDDHNLSVWVNAETGEPIDGDLFGHAQLTCWKHGAELPAAELGVVTRETLRQVHGALDLAAADTPPEWLIEPLAERGQFVSIYGPAGVGKSLLAQDHAFRLAAQGCRVLYLDHENTPDEVKARFRAMGYATWPSTLTYCTFPRVSALDTAAGTAALHALAEGVDPELIVLDTWSKFLAGKESEPSTHTSAYAAAIVPLRRRGVTVLALDHPGKELARGPRGGSSKVDNVDVLWLLTAKSDGRLRLERKKSRTGRGVDLVELARAAEPLRHVRARQRPSDTLTPDVRACVAKLDALEVPSAWGRDRAAQVLRANGYTTGNDVLSAAIKVRKGRGDAPADALDLSVDSADRSGQVDE